MLRYLNNQMNAHREFSGERALRFRDRFSRVVELVAENLVRPFRPRGVLNVAMLEGVMVALLENDTITGEQLKVRYKKLADDPKFDGYLRGSTTDTLIVKERIKIAKDVLGNAEG